MSRTCLVIEQLSKYSDGLDPEEKLRKGLLPVRSRMGANVTLRTIFRARECSTQQQTIQDETESKDPSQATEWLDMFIEDLCADINGDQLFLDTPS